MTTQENVDLQIHRPARNRVLLGNAAFEVLLCSIIGTLVFFSAIIILFGQGTVSHNGIRPATLTGLAAGFLLALLRSWRKFNFLTSGCIGALIALVILFSLNAPDLSAIHWHLDSRTWKLLIGSVYLHSLAGLTMGLLTAVVSRDIKNFTSSLKAESK